MQFWLIESEKAWVNKTTMLEPRNTCAYVTSTRRLIDADNHVIEWLAFFRDGTQAESKSYFKRISET